ncbi:hypothetical protein RAS1_41970 [Phycisphaerae bacterium RAS1]|nr:hypothetical protein RAS1_41970 [Phycisphaerae bacterium RAS1]
MLPNREGRFKATILEHGVAETGQNKLATFVVRFQLIQELINGEWNPVEEELDITGYFYLEKKDGTINAVTIDNLTGAFGWDGRDPFWLQDADFGQLVVQVKLAFEQYNNRTRIKVQYVDAEDASPAGVPQADDAARRSIATRLGAKFRANAGGTPAPAPKPPAGTRPSAPKAKPSAAQAPKPSTPAAPAPQGLTMQQAWDAFAKACPANCTPENVESEWFRLLGEMFPGKQPEQLTPPEWATFVSEAPPKVVPF